MGRLVEVVVSTVIAKTMCHVTRWQEGVHETNVPQNGKVLLVHKVRLANRGKEQILVPMKH